MKNNRRIVDKYSRILRFFEDYITTYSEYGQDADTISMMDKFYALDLSFPEDMVYGREQWYQRCLNHPDVLDRLTIEHCIIDERKNEASAILKTEAIDRAKEAVLMDLRMHALYKLRIDVDDDISITEVRLFLESNPEKVARLAQLYRIGI
jgi:hypothetical protein